VLIAQSSSLPAATEKRARARAGSRER